MSMNMRRELLKGGAADLSKEDYEKLSSRVYSLSAVAAYEGQNRRINRFMLGADPEFIFMQDGAPVYAAALGLRPGLAFGSDQNDRLVELRPAPSRSAFEVVASTLAELRWLYRLFEPARIPLWVAGAYQAQDGLGGHVHFGRKQVKLRSLEVTGLDGLAMTMRATNIFPVQEWNRRCKGDAHGQRYGLYGDIRQQKHGYEYRTLPSWLESPWLAMLVLTLSKLVIMDPEITGSWKGEKENAWERLCGLAKYYKGRDDDAWLLCTLMQNRSVFEWIGGDFKPRWGLTGSPGNGNVCTYPQVLQPTDEDCEDLMNLFTQGTALPMREVMPNFRARIPLGYEWIIPNTSPSRRPGIGDLIPDVVTAAGPRPKVCFHFDPDATSLRLDVPVNVDPKLFKLPEVPGMYTQVRRSSESDSYWLYVGRDWRKGLPLHELRKWMLSGVLPMWTVDDVQSDSLEKWIAAQPEKLAKPAFSIVDLLAA